MPSRQLLLCFSFAFLFACGRPSIPSALSPQQLVLDPHPLGPAPSLPEGVRVRALTLNVHGGADAAPEAIAAFLRGQDPDVIALTECPAVLAQQLASLASYPFVVGEGEVLLSKTALEDFAQVNLDAGRSFAHAETTLGGVRFSLYAAHLGWNVSGLLQCREFTDRFLAKDPRAHLLLLGDFNDEHLSKQIGVLEEQVTDAFTAVGWLPSDRISWPSTGFDGTEGSQLIDLLFFSRALPALVLDAGVVNVVPPLSDHKPVWAELLYPRGDEPFAMDPFAGRGDPWGGWPAEGERPPNLLVNPGAEQGLDGWTTEGDPRSELLRSTRTPHAGERFFTGLPFNDTDLALRVSSASQRVNLASQAAAIDAGRGLLWASAWFSTGVQLEELDGVTNSRPRPYCDAEVIVELLDESDNVLDRIPSGRRDTLQWTAWARRIPLPPRVRAARVTFASHHKLFSGVSNDGAIDDLYLGFSESGASEAFHALSGNLLADGAAEQGGAAFTMSGFEVIPDLRILGALLFPPWSWSGRALFHAGGLPGLSMGQPGDSELSQRVELPRSLFDAIDRCQVALRWGGRARTLDGRGPVRLSLSILDAQGSVWGTLDAPPMSAPEWSLVEQLTLLPQGAAGVRLVARASVEEKGSGAFVDELFARPEPHERSCAQ